jgi:hypothetical protein
VLVPNGMIVDRIDKLAQNIYDDYVAKGHTPHILGKIPSKPLRRGPAHCLPHLQLC